MKDASRMLLEVFSRLRKPLPILPPHLISGSSIFIPIIVPELEVTISDSQFGHLTILTIKRYPIDKINTTPNTG